MFNNAKIRTLERRQEALMTAVQVLAVDVARSHRKISFDKPIELKLRPLSEFRDKGVAGGLRQLFDKAYFDICLLKSLAELAGVYLPDDLLRHVQPLHCVDWTRMDPEYRSQIQQHIIAAFIPVEAEANETEEA